MKLKEINKILLTKEDMVNKDKLDKRLDEMLGKIEEYKSKIMKEYAEKEDVNTFKTLYNSTDRYNELIRIYKRYDKCIEALLFGLSASFTGIFSFINSPLIGQLEPTAIISIVTIFGLISTYTGFKHLLIRRNIKKNFKELGIKLNENYM